MQISDSIVIIPTYNERENIENIIRAVFALKHGFHILVIEDGRYRQNLTERVPQTPLHGGAQRKAGIGNSLYSRL